MSAPGATAADAPRARPGRPSSGARERILAAALETLKAEGYAGLTLAKVASHAGENKALVSYHFGSKPGLIAAAARELGKIIERILVAVEDASSVEAITRGSLAGTWEVLEQDARLPRVYFDLNAVSIVEDDVRAVMREVKTGFRTMLVDLLRNADDAPPARDIPALAVLIIAGIEGLCLEWIERGDTPELRLAKEQFVRSIVAGLDA